MTDGPTRVTIFNHKGGVGKTTLTVNIAAAIADKGQSVLLVDSDPQCNLTSYLLADDVVDDLLDHSGGPQGATIWSAVKPIFDRMGVGKHIEPQEIGDLHLIPGDIKLSEFEETLAEAWTDSFRRRLGGLQTVSAISTLVDNLSAERHYDYVFFDTGPNIGPLNRVLLLDSDFFLVPVACDLFSVRALATLGTALSRWIQDAATIASIAPDDAPVLRGRPVFLGYIPQRFKVYGRTMARQPALYFRQIRRRVFADISSVLRKLDKSLAPPSSVDPRVGAVKDFASLAQAAQREGVPIWSCTSYVRPDEQEAAEYVFEEIASYVIEHADRR
ncbi:MAG: AAA family ATPase [Gammaproteobacteria bacterium]|nr:AAA family ATPase [Gammaproteobacteria bacterium]